MLRDVSKLEIQEGGFIISNPSSSIVSAISDSGICDLSIPTNLNLNEEDSEIPED